MSDSWFEVDVMLDSGGGPRVLRATVDRAAPTLADAGIRVLSLAPDLGAGAGDHRQWAGRGDAIARVAVDAEQLCEAGYGGELYPDEVPDAVHRALSERLGPGLDLFGGRLLAVDEATQIQVPDPEVDLPVVPGPQSRSGHRLAGELLALCREPGDPEPSGRQSVADPGFGR